MKKIVVRVVVMVDSSSDGDGNSITEQSPLLVGLRSGTFRGGGQEDWDVIVVATEAGSVGSADCDVI